MKLFETIHTTHLWIYLCTSTRIYIRMFHFRWLYFIGSDSCHLRKLVVLSASSADLKLKSAIFVYTTFILVIFTCLSRDHSITTYGRTHSVLPDALPQI